MILSRRLQDIADLCSDPDILIDVGCDHAMIPISMIEKGRIKYAVATDINEGPIKAAERNAEDADVRDKMRFITADGLQGLDPSDPLFKGKRVTLLISGMGGPLIEKIISEGREFLPVVENFVFSPHSKIPEFRKFLGENGFEIKNEKLTKEEGKYYFIIFCQKGGNSCKDETDYELGPVFFEKKDDHKRDYLAEKLRTYEELCNNPAIKGDRAVILDNKRLLYERSISSYDLL